MQQAGILLALGAFLLAGCTGGIGGDSDDDFVTPPQDDAGRYVIEMLPTNKFSPAKAEIPAGSTVVWVNKGGGHNSVADGGQWRLPGGNDLSSEGDELEQAFEVAGTFKYHCVPHESLGMKGTIRVV